MAKGYVTGGKTLHMSVNIPRRRSIMMDRRRRDVIDACGYARDAR